MVGDQLVMDLTGEQGPGRETQVQPPLDAWRQYFRVDGTADELPVLRLVNTRAAGGLEAPRRVVRHHHNLTVEIAGAVAPRPAIIRFAEIGKHRYEYAVYRPGDSEYDAYDGLLDEIENPFRTRPHERRWFVAWKRRPRGERHWLVRAADVDARVRRRREELAEEDEVAAAQNAIAELAGEKAEGQGYESFTPRRKAIEDHAMEKAIAYFGSRGWSVRDVSATRPYDLECTRRRGRELLHVEVKGTTSSGASILLTRNEVEHARNIHPNVALFILARVRVVPGDPPRATGGTAIVRQPWDIEGGELEPLAYKYRLP
jgi:hypothetical protein